LFGINVLVFTLMELALWQVVIMVYRHLLKKSPLRCMIMTHCIIHREALASKIISPSLNEVLLSVIEIVNFIKTRLIKSRCFEKMCEDMGAEHTVAYYCNSRWLSRGNGLKRVFDFRKELYCFLLEQKKHFEKFEN